MKKKVRILNYQKGNGLLVFKALRECTDYEFNHCKMITDEMNPRYYEEFKDERMKPATHCDILVYEDISEYFVEELKSYGRNCIILDDNDETFKETKYF